MKALIALPALAGAMLCFVQCKAQKETAKDHITKEFAVKAGTTLAVYNLVGDVHVQGYSGSKVVIDVDQEIIADNASYVEEAKKEFKLGFDEKSDSLVVYTAEPYDTRPRRSWSDDKGGHQNRHYLIKLTYTIKVPSGLNVAASTVNDGEVSVADIYGILNVNNVNGKISISNAKGTTRAHTVNGGVTVSYLNAPSGDSDYRTVNGKIEVSFPASMNADLQFKSMNGQFYTDFTNTEVMPAQVTKSESKKQQRRGVSPQQKHPRTHRAGRARPELRNPEREYLCQKILIPN